jgi:hypothetical protein
MQAESREQLCSPEMSVNFYHAPEESAHPFSFCLLLYFNVFVEGRVFCECKQANTQAQHTGVYDYKM